MLIPTYFKSFHISFLKGKHLLWVMSTSIFICCLKQCFSCSFTDSPTRCWKAKLTENNTGYKSLLQRFIYPKYLPVQNSIRDQCFFWVVVLVIYISYYSILKKKKNKDIYISSWSVCYIQQWKMNLAVRIPGCLLLTPQSWHVAPNRIHISLLYCFFLDIQI